MYKSFFYKERFFFFYHLKSSNYGHKLFVKEEGYEWIGIRVYVWQEFLSKNKSGHPSGS